MVEADCLSFVPSVTVVSGSVVGRILTWGFSALGSSSCVDPASSELLSAE